VKHLILALGLLRSMTVTPETTLVFTDYAVAEVKTQINRHHAGAVFIIGDKLCFNRDQVCYGPVGLVVSDRP